jgi:ferrous iron transport protein B
MRLALLGHPNCGKTALFNLLTGSRQKVANYAGVTVERKEGVLTSPAGKTVRVLDLPGAYSLNALSADEAVTRDVVTGQRAGEAAPDLLVCVVDATKLQLGLRMVLEARAMGLPMVVAMNMSDAARRQGIAIDRALLERELGMPVVETVGIRKDGASALVQWLDGWQPAGGAQASAWQPQGPAQVLQTQQEVRRILRLAVREPEGLLRRDDAIDRVVLHPLWGMLVLAATMFLMFQAVFSWAAVPMDAIESGVGAVGGWLQSQLPEGLLRSLLVEGIVAGAGGRAGVPAADRHPVLLHPHAGGFGLPAARGLSVGPRDGQRGAVGAFVHSAAVELCLRHSGHHGHAHHHALARAAGHHLHCAAHDLFGTPAGVCALDCRLHS